jgi:hypothetical protein
MFLAAIGESSYLLDFHWKPPGKYESEDENRPTATEDLAGYLWDNYIEYADLDRVPGDPDKANHPY